MDHRREIKISVINHDSVIWSWPECQPLPAHMLAAQQETVRLQVNSRSWGMSMSHYSIHLNDDWATSIHWLKAVCVCVCECYKEVLMLLLELCYSNQTPPTDDRLAGDQHMGPEPCGQTSTPPCRHSTSQRLCQTCSCNVSIKHTLCSGKH